MIFDQLLGNARLKENMLRSIRTGHISHFYLISGPEGAGKHTLAKLLAAAILCRSGEKPCGTCPACRKVLADSHPDFITVDDPQKKTVPVDLIRQTRADMFILPNEADRKIYLLPRAQDISVSGQNALLKVLEEPPPYGVFILLSTNPQKLLPTVRSRCTELHMLPLSQSELTCALQKEFPKADAESVQAAVHRSGGYLGQAKTLLQGEGKAAPQTVRFANAYASGNAVELVSVLVSMEKWKRDALTELLQSWSALLQEALVCRCGGTATDPLARNIAAKRTPQELMDSITHLRKCIDYAQSNVAPAAICGYLQWTLRN